MAAIVVAYGLAITAATAPSPSSGSARWLAAERRRPASMPLPSQGLSDGSLLLFRSTTHDSDYGRIGAGGRRRPRWPPSHDVAVV